jgi:hypothetical protein
MKNKNAWVFRPLLIILLVVGFSGSNALAGILKKGDKTFLVDQTGYRWDITQAVSIGFDPKKFEFGIGKNAFNPLEEGDFKLDSKKNHPKMRVIGVAGEGDAHAYAVDKLWRHETANTFLGSIPIVAGY